MSLELFIRLADSLVEFDADFADNRYPVTSAQALEIHRTEINNTWSRIKSAYEQFLFDAENEEKTDPDPKREPLNLESIKAKYKSTYITYCNCLANISELYETRRSESHPKPDLAGNSSATGRSLSKGSDSNSFHLPPCNIMTFDGTYSAWPTFHDLFEAVYIKNRLLSPVEKLLHLAEKTTKDAHDIVAECPLTNKGFDLAWGKLCARYENRRALVNIQIRALLNLQAITSESPDAIRQLQHDINACISGLKLYDIEVDKWDALLVLLCTDRLPYATLHLWEQSLSDKTAVPQWSAMDSFLSDRYRTLESVSESRKVTNLKPIDTTSKHSAPTSRSSKRVQTFQTHVTGPKCALCPGESHPIRKCPEFLKLDQAQRLIEIKNQNLCINCFSKTHGVRNCNSKHSCFKCNKRHNTLLHKDSADPSRSSNSNSSPPITSASSILDAKAAPFPSTSDTSSLQSTKNSGARVVQTYFISNSKHVFIGTAMVDVCHLGTRLRVRALIDPASEGSFISEDVMKLLLLPSRRTKLNDVSGMGDIVSASVQRECSFILGSPLDSNVQIPVDALIVPRVASSLPSRPIDAAQFSDLPEIQLADPKFYDSSKVDILIGGDYYPSVMLPGTKYGVCKSLMAQETKFGWILTGPVFSNTTTLPSTIASYMCKISLDKEISRFWEVENLPRKNFLSPSDQFCENLFIRTTTRNEDGRYVVSLPFKEGYPEKLRIGPSRNGSMAQFFRNEARLLRTPSFKEEYDGVVEEYLKLGHMAKVDPPDSLETPLHYYLPHHAVLKPESTTTKVRVVFNASSVSSNGLSLNDILHIGPILQNDLTFLILKWRLFRYVFNADIQKMYRQILVDSKHTSFQRILFRKDPNDIVQDYELKTVTFGVNCAPYLAIRVLLQLADDVQAIYPIASHIIRNSMYVDDVLAGNHTIQEAIQSRNELILALQTAGFSLRKWTANTREILCDLPSEHLLHQDFLEFDESSTTKTLGIRWNARSDSFYFTAMHFSESSSYTKREVLAQIAKLFDPAGWLAPCVVLAKILMQKIWVDGTGWDEVLTPDALSQWKTFQSNYSFINHIRIPRWIDYVPDADIQIHGFCDASEKAYAAALYIRISTGNSISSHLVFSKTKVAPIKTLSIPRLELCGAVLLAEMLDSLLPRLDVPQYSIFCWTDSTIVLCWLSKPPCFWMTFVANRVSKITQVVDPSHWHHVNSDTNPADLASRGLYPHDIIDNDLWWFGPKWLQSSESCWPDHKSKTRPDIDLERKPIKVHFSYFQSFEDVLERFSSFSRAMRVMAYVYRFFYRTHPRYRSSFHKESVVVTGPETVAVRDRLICMYQKAFYPNEYKALSSRQSISSSSSILNLNPFLDPEGIIRSCGRLETSPGLSYNEKHPIIIPYSCQFSRLLVKFVHDISLHGGNQLVLRLIRTQYWVPKVKNLIKGVINQCKSCIIYKRRCQKQMMAALPPERTEISRPFTHTGLDFAGPFEIKSYLGRACKITKGYVCVFVCFSTKAIHLEGTSDLSTSAFLAAFHRFVSRRGCPLHLHSDNGTTFVGASKTLAKEFIQTSHLALTANYAHQNITWHFIPPGAPHMGGLWEAGVKSFKSHFRKIAGNFRYTFEEFNTLLSRIEACLNSRPLSPVSQDPSDFSALTPGHFLIGSPLLSPIDPPIDATPVSINNRWQRLKVLHQHFCSRWKSEYLCELQKRNKWQKPEENLNENALVVVKDENLPPNSWRLGRIVKVYLGSDKRVRVADVLTERGTITRPISKLVLLFPDSSS